MKLIFESKVDLSEWYDDEIANYIVRNFKRITGYPIKVIFNLDSEEWGDDTPVFNQDGVEKTYDAIVDFLTVRCNKTRREVDDFMDYIDDYLLQVYDRLVG